MTRQRCARGCITSNLSEPMDHHSRICRCTGGAALDLPAKVALEVRQRPASDPFSPITSPLGCKNLIFDLRAAPVTAAARLWRDDARDGACGARPSRAAASRLAPIESIFYHIKPRPLCVQMCAGGTTV